MIYFDNASTSYPKPLEVKEAVRQAIETSANPGRGAHVFARDAAKFIFKARESLAELFGITDPKNIVFTLNATQGLNLALKGLLKPGDHVITSSLEHNSVNRTLAFLEKRGIEMSRLTYEPVSGINIEELENAIKPNTKLVCLTHVSNVTGTVLPIKEVAAICKKNKILFMVDAAQSAGHFIVEPEKLGIDVLVFSGHKGLLGPTGVGAIYVSEKVELPELIQGATGGHGEDVDQPLSRPDRYESGTMNVSGIAGLGAGVRLIKKIGLSKIEEKEAVLINEAIDALENISGLEVYRSRGKQGPVISFNLEKYSPSELACRLESDYSIATRAGLHCAPLAHKSLGTFPGGSVRASLNYFNSKDEVDILVRALEKLKKK
ncbi:MAG: aminotransferase class V-fold PLP-dependent enzyme [Actinobacteria bacterium]|nr:MAG: aminotransferase class V-fold PLP-dependent enzyme [Actinomycetota bacterium]